MCGIIGILSKFKTHSLYGMLVQSLIQLQNRGYDSSGIALINDKQFDVVKFASVESETSIEKLQKINLDIETNIGIGHNRWATHGGKTDINAHPHMSNNGKFILVHNGIIENYSVLKQFLIEKGYHFYSQTDTEVIVNLIQYYSGSESEISVFKSIRKTINMLEGTYGIIVSYIDEPDTLYCVRNGSPLCVGKNDDFAFITSEQAGFCGNVNNYITLNNDDICIIKSNYESNKKYDIDIQTFHNYIEKKVYNTENCLSPEPFKFWTLKEIFEQPKTVLNCLNRGGRIKNSSEIKLGGLEQNIESLKDIEHIILLGCGTSYYASLMGMYYLKNVCSFSTVQVFDGAEFNEYDIPKSGKTCCVLVSQSGETKDLHRCIEITKNANIMTIGVINVVDSLIAREVDCGIYCNAGREIGVASTKAFTSQVICLSLMAIWFAQVQKVNERKRIQMIKDLHNLSNDIQMTLDMNNEKVEEVAKKLVCHSNFFILGKSTDEYVGKEGSLKIKEISYIHAEGYSASSLKHGPFALLDESFPCILLDTCDKYHSKVLNCFEEVYARNAPILYITHFNEDLPVGKVFTHLPIVKNQTFSSLIGIIPFQLLAYYLSVEKGINPDIPKNLAKVVTVE